MKEEGRGKRRVRRLIGGCWWLRFDMCVIWLGSVKGRGKSHRKVRRSVDGK